MPSSIPARRRLAALLLAAAAGTLRAQPPAATFSGEVRATAIEVPVSILDAEGLAPGAVQPADLRLLEDGREVPVLAVERLAPQQPSATGPRALLADRSWQVVVYFDLALAARGTVQGTAEALAREAEQLARLGSVEVVAADPAPELLLAPTRDAAKLGRELARLAKRLEGRDEVARLRRELAEAIDADDLQATLRRGPERPSRSAPTGGGGLPPGSVQIRNPVSASEIAGGPSGARGAQQEALIRAAAQQEAHLLGRRRALLLDWMAFTARPRRPRALIYVADGYDLDPAEFYLSYLTDAARAAGLRAHLTGLGGGEASERHAELLAASGWLVLPVSLSQAGARAAGGAESAGRSRHRAFGGDGRSFSRGGVSAFLLRAPLDPLHGLADLSGGRLLLTPAQIAEETAALAERWLVTYQVERPPDGISRRLEIEPLRPGWTVRAPRIVAAAAPDAVAAAQARHLLETGGRAGDLPLSASAAPAPGSREAGAETVLVDLDLDLRPLGVARSGLDAADLRITLAVLLPDGRVFVSQQRPEPGPLGEAARFAYRVPLRIPAGTATAAAVVEELRSGAWAGVRIALPR